MSWISDAINDAVDIVKDFGDSLFDPSEWDDFFKRTWNTDIGRFAIVMAAGYAANSMLTSTTAMESTVASATAESAALPAVAPGSIEAIGAESIAGMTGAEVTPGLDFMGQGALTETTMMAEGAPIATGTTAVAGGSSAITPPVTPPADPGVFETNPMLAYGGMMVGGQAASGYMQGEAQKEIEQQRLDEEAADRDRQNIYGVNYANPNRNAPINPFEELMAMNERFSDVRNIRPEQYVLPAARQEQGVLDELAGRARPSSARTYPTRVN